MEGGELEVLEGGQQLLAGPLAPRAILFESKAVCDIAALLESHGYTVRAVYYSLNHGLEFVPAAEQQCIRALKREYYGQPTLDYLALKSSDAEADFARLSRGPRRIAPRLVRLAAHYC